MTIIQTFTSNKANTIVSFRFRGEGARTHRLRRPTEASKQVSVVVVVVGRHVYAWANVYDELTS